MIPPKQKAEQLFDIFTKVECSIIHQDCEGDIAISTGMITADTAKQCALICVEGIIKALHKADTAYDLIPEIEYWNKVKTEIKSL